MQTDKWLVPAEKARWRCDPAEFDFSSTAEISPLEGALGQDRAVRSLDFGFKIETKGFNIFAAGPPGTGKHSSVTSYVQELAESEPVPSDWCYVNNFKNADRPIAIKLPSGEAEGFSRDMGRLVDACRAEIPKAFDSEEYDRRKDEILGVFQEKRDRSLEHLRKHAEEKNFSVEITSAGVITIPIVDGKLMKRDEFDNLDQKQRERIKTETDALQVEINRIMAGVRSLEKKAKDRILALDKETALFAVGHLLDDLAKHYAGREKIISYLDDVRKDIVEDLESFKTGDKKPSLGLPGLEMPEQEPPFEKYKVNVFIANPDGAGAPVVFEPNPTYYNLFGRLEYAARLGAMLTSFTMIKPGAVHRANGGYLILGALDLLLNPFSYDALKRTLKTQESRIENIGEQFRIVPAATLQPEPIPMDLKVVLIGGRRIYDLLYSLDEDFRKLFKVKADFDTDMARTSDHTRNYAELVSAKCRKDNLKNYDPSGVAKIVEHGVRLAEDREKLTTRILELNDLISEASYWASTNGNTLVNGDDVTLAINERIERSDMFEEKLQEYFADGTILVDIAGDKVGQVNGLSIIFLGDYVFGKPSRITSKVFTGKKGIINIEREANLSGSIHDKAVFILSGYLGGLFANDKPLSMTATISFEQSYGLIEGDSASSTELYALISSLADVPIKQNIAVTGSVNQQGQIQPIGGVNRKIEGFYDVCQAKGFTGEQGVMIPKRNLKNLALREDVVEAIEAGRWRLWAIDTIDEGLEVLTGRKAGKHQPDGGWEKDSVNYLADRKLRYLSENMQRFATGAERYAA